jgi:hypothetical protein
MEVARILQLVRSGVAAAIHYLAGRLATLPGGGAAMTVATPNPPVAPRQVEHAEPGKRVGGVQRVCGLSKSEAEDLLDWLEVHRFRVQLVEIEVGGGFTVEYEIPHPHRN